MYKLLTANDQGPVFQSIVSLTKPLVEDLLNCSVLTKSTAPIIFAKKLYESFALQKFLTFFHQKYEVFLRITTNNVVSFEQLS